MTGGANPENWNKVQSQADYLYNSHVVIPVTTAATLASAGGLAAVGPASIGYQILRSLLAGTIGYETANLGSELLTGQTVDQHISDDLQGIFNFSKEKADILSPFLNPGGWLSAGKYMRPLLGIADTPLQKSINNIVLRTQSPSWLDRHTAPIQKILNPWLSSKDKVNTALNLNDGVLTFGQAEWQTPFRHLSTPTFLKYFQPTDPARQYYKVGSGAAFLILQQQCQLPLTYYYTILKIDQIGLQAQSMVFQEGLY